MPSRRPEPPPPPGDGWVEAGTVFVCVGGTSCRCRVDAHPLGLRLDGGVHMCPRGCPGAWLPRRHGRRCRSCPWGMWTTVGAALTPFIACSLRASHSPHLLQ